LIFLRAVERGFAFYLSRLYSIDIEKNQNTTPVLNQSIDYKRPHTLLTKSQKQAGSLLYRYDDTQEVTLVPNIWYNQPYMARVEYMRWRANLHYANAEKVLTSPPKGLSSKDISELISRCRTQAIEIEALAAKIEAAGVATHPVAASNISLHLSAELEEGISEDSDEDPPEQDPPEQDPPEQDPPERERR
jgi:hypothetical protein